MTTPRQIADALAKERRVETMVQNIAHARALSQDLRDLCQMVYLFLIETDDEKIADLWTKSQMGFYVACIIRKQLLASSSQFLRAYRKFSSRTVPLEGHDREDEQ